MIAWRRNGIIENIKDGSTIKKNNEALQKNKTRKYNFSEDDWVEEDTL
jgi:hypothetical protein